MEFLKNFSDVKVLIVGDIMLDRYCWGSVNRISPEAPVPIVNLEKTSSVLGGAANVAANVAGLGAEPYLIGVVGQDDEADIIRDALKSNFFLKDSLISSTERQTTIKTRIVAHNQQIVRIDQETKAELSLEEELAIWEKISEKLEQVEIVVVSDYAKGVLTNTLLARLITKCRDLGLLILVDPKGKNFRKYYGATMLTPNRHEIVLACNLDNYNQDLVEDRSSKLLNELGLKYLLVTQGEDGMTLFESNKQILHLPVEPRNVYDVTGAGDTVIACLAVCMGAGANFAEAAQFANRAAGLVIEKIGTTAITLEMLKQSPRTEQ